MGGLELEGQVVIITGGSSGLGKALARRLAERGAKLALVARDVAKLEAARDEVLESAGRGAEVATFSCDVADYAAVQKTFSAIAAELGPPRLLVNSAGILREGYFERVPLETFHSVMDINYYGTLHCVKAVLPWFEKQGRGWIVNICSIGGRHGGFGYTAYSSSKFAVMGLTESLRGELKPRGVRVQVVCPAEFESPMVEQLNKDRTPENRQVVHTFPVLDAERVADAVVRGMERKRYMIIPDWRVRWLDWSANSLPFISRIITDTQVRLARRMKGGSSMPSPQARIARAGVRVSGLLVSAYLPVKYQRFMLNNAAPAWFLGARSCGLEREERCCVPAVWLDPRGADQDRVLLFLHGGGFVLGNVGSHHKMVSRLAEAAGCRALMIEYGLAPENHFPTAVEDSVGAYRWLLSEGYEPENIALAGDSAGGSLTVAALVSLRDAGGPLPAAAVLISPWLDLEVTGSSARSNAFKDPLLKAFDLKKWGRMYLGGADPRDPLASPIYADLRGLPPMLIQVGAREVLLDDARRLAEKAERDGTPVELEVWEEMWHDWHVFAPTVPESREAVRKIGWFLREKMG